jgi:hypothetical protein
MKHENPMKHKLVRNSIILGSVVAFVASATIAFAQCQEGYGTLYNQRCRPKATETGSCGAPFWSEPLQSWRCNGTVEYIYDGCTYCAAETGFTPGCCTYPQIQQCKRYRRNIDCVWQPGTGNGICVKFPQPNTTEEVVWDKVCLL